MIFVLGRRWQTSRQPRSGPGFLQSMLAPVSINSFTWSGVFVINIMTSNDPSGNYDDDDDDDDDDYDDGWWWSSPRQHPPWDRRAWEESTPLALLCSPGSTSSSSLSFVIVIIIIIIIILVKIIIIITTFEAGRSWRACGTRSFLPESNICKAVFRFTWVFSF